MQKLYREVLNGTLDQTFSKGLSRREFLKLTAGVLGVYATSGITGCLNGKPKETPPPTLTPMQIKQKEWLDRYNEDYGANLTLDDLPLPAEKAVHQLKMYENITDFEEPEIGDGKGYFGGEYPGFEKIVRDALNLLKEKNYPDYVYISKQGTKEIRYMGARHSGNSGEFMYIGSVTLDTSIKSTACTMVHESVHRETGSLLKLGIIQEPNEPDWSEALAYKIGAECSEALS